MSIAQTLTAPDGFGPWLGDPEPWAAWLAILKGAMAEPLTEAEAATFRKLTERDPPTEPVRELWVIAGRRSGKSAMAAGLATYWAAILDHRTELRGGEVATIPVIAQDRGAARHVFRYCRALLEATGLDTLIERETNEMLELSTGAALEITTASARSTRGYSMPLIVADEIAHWRAESSSEPDTEILEALRPAQATFRRPLLVAISSPHARRGALWNTYKAHWGQPGPVLVVNGATADFNPTIPQDEIDRSVARDPALAQAEWFGRFRTDIEAFLSTEAVEGVTVPDRFELPYRADQKYVGFVDLSGGVRDSAALAIAHREDGETVLDLVREIQAPHSPEAATEQFADILKGYRLNEAHADRYAAQWAVDRFAEHGVALVHSDRARSDLYLELLPAINSAQVALLDHPKLRAQLVGLERRTSRSGRDSVDHPPGGSDDVANATAGALVVAAAQPDATPARTPRLSNSGMTSTTEQRLADYEAGWRGETADAATPGSVAADSLGWAPVIQPDRKEVTADEERARKRRTYLQAMSQPTPVGARWDWDRECFVYADGRIARRRA